MWIVECGAFFSAHISLLRHHDLNAWNRLKADSSPFVSHYKYLAWKTRTGSLTKGMTHSPNASLVNNY